MRAGERSHPIFSSAYVQLAKFNEKGPIGRNRRDLCAQASGVVVDLGAGTGLNIPHLGEAVTAIHLVEPDSSMIRRLARFPDPRITIHPCAAESINLPNGSADVVLAMLTLCTVTDVDAVAREIRRVVKPGGRLLLLEHVEARSDSDRRWQHRVNPLWCRVSAGCSLLREPLPALAAAGFDTAEVARFRLKAPPTWDWLAGSLPTVDDVKPG